MANRRLHAILGKKGRKLRLAIITGIVAIGYIITLGTSIVGFLPAEFGIHSEKDSGNVRHRKLLATEEDSNSTDQGVYPPEAFTLEQLRSGAVILHVFGLIYMFVALAIVCDEFFVPALGVIIERFDISEDVAGATFMAAGGSAPELFISIIGVFLAKNNVGIGTIVGSAVFNILFVIGMCALFSREVLKLTWWPLFRDVSFYSFDLILLIVFFLDAKIEWWEALVLFMCYFAYVTFMKFNPKIERAFKSCLQKTSLNKVQSTDSLLNEKAERSCSLPILHAGAGRFRHGMLQLMIHTIDPIGNGEAKVDDKAMHMHAMATLQVLIDAQNKKESVNGIQNGAFDKSDNTKIHVISNGQVSPDSNRSGETRKSPSASQETTSTTLDTQEDQYGKVTRRDVDVHMNNNDLESTSDSKSESSPNFQEVEEPMDLSWPDTTRERVTYVLVAPIVYILWFTLPDVRRPEKKKWFFCSFLGSILWIGLFSYLMVWWANTVGTTAEIPDEVMGLTILAAGTSIPDLITSVIVAKKGFGDMAVSSSVGSNIFDITVGLPFPWLLNSAIRLGAPTLVSSKGLFCSIVLLFIMLVAVISSIAVSKWRMSKMLGFSMFVLYIIFLTLSVLLELDIIICFDRY